MIFLKGLAFSGFFLPHFSFGAVRGSSNLCCYLRRTYAVIFRFVGLVASIDERYEQTDEGMNQRMEKANDLFFFIHIK